MSRGVMLLTKVFISHSQRDSELVDTIISFLENIDIDPIVEEFKPEEEKHHVLYEEIRRSIKSCDAVFLFLTDEVMMTEHTKNWVIFEDGLALGTEKQVFLFERAGKPLKYPVPYLTDYMIFEEDSAQDILKMQKISKQLKSYFSIEEKRTLPRGFEREGGLVYIPYLVLKMKMKGKSLKKLGVPKVDCPNCGISFNYYSPSQKIFKCPACRGSYIKI